MAVKGLLIGVSSSKLTELKTAYEDCLLAIAEAGQSYSIGQRTFTRADISQVRETLGDINYALELAQGTRTRVAKDCFNPGWRQ